MSLAEGIETAAQYSLLQNLGCDSGQGYLMSKPLPKDDLEKTLYQKRTGFLLQKPFRNKPPTIHRTKRACICFECSSKSRNPTSPLGLTSNAHYTK
ncbi:MAG: hypothetical protein ABI686_06975 [Acidobacteriota bacterium]